ncbi:MAG: polysaccharide biosynthesis/export family protein [Verrucomicrobiales bacterium]
MSASTLLLITTVISYGLVACTVPQATIKSRDFADRKITRDAISEGCCADESRVAELWTARIGRRQFPVRVETLRAKINEPPHSKRRGIKPKPRNKMEFNENPSVFDLRGLRQEISPKLPEKVIELLGEKTPNRRPAYTISSGDVLHISIFAGGEKQEDFMTDVSPQGMMTSPLIGDIHVAGLTVSTVAGMMTELFERDFFVNPKVWVKVKEFSKEVYVMGEVQSPGGYKFHEGLTVLNACILAGGFTDYAMPNRVKVTRSSDGVINTIEINLLEVQQGKASDLVLAAGDRIDVPQRWF